MPLTTACPRSIRRALAVLLVPLLPACAHRGGAPDEHAGHAPAPASATATISTAASVAPALPPSGDEASARLAASPRHGEWVMIPLASGSADSVRAWVVYPERATKAPVVVVVHEIFGLSTWIRSVADQLAADGFIAVAPDFLTGHPLASSPDAMPMDSAMAAIRRLDGAKVQRQIDAAARYGMALPAALPRYGVVGFCWGGSVVFDHAIHAPTLGASVVYYGSSPRDGFARITAPVLGLYGGNDARVNATIPRADSAMRALGRTFEPVIYPGAGHGFLRQQGGQNGANMEAARQAWPRTVAWFRQHLGA